MRPKIHCVFLTDDRAALYRLVSGGTAPARQLTHARILLKSDEGPDDPAWTDAAITEALEIDRAIVARAPSLRPRRPRRRAHPSPGARHQAAHALRRRRGAPDRPRL